MSLFPLISAPPAAEAGSAGSLPLAREIAWDFERNVPVWRGGQPVYVTGQKAVKVWAWNALHAQRGRHAVYTWDYGLGIHALTGRTWSEDIKRSEAIRYVRECLLVNPYITSVEQISVELDGSTLKVEATMNTVYGEVTLRGVEL